MYDDSENWRDRARCLGLDTSVFYPEHGPDLDNSGSDGKAVCVDCPVRGECLEHAIRNNESHGIWGGVGEDRRRYVRRIYLESLASGNPWPYRDALAEEEQEIGRAYGSNDEAREWQARRRCPSCHEWIPAGAHPLNRNGPDAQCGLASTYNKGCRCRLCEWGKAKYAKLGGGTMGPARDTVDTPADRPGATRRRKA